MFINHQVMHGIVFHEDFFNAVFAEYIDNENVPLSMSIYAWQGMYCGA